VPDTIPIFDPLGGPDLRNLHRPDLAQCSLWYGGPLGTLTVPGQIPPAVPLPGFHGILAAGASSACRRAEALARLSAHGDSVFARALTYLETAGNYTDPNGNVVRYGYDRAIYSAGLGLARPDGSFLSFDVTKSEKRNVLYAGAPLDTRYFDATNYALRGRAVLDAGPLQAIRANASFTEFDRENDNFSYRSLIGQPTVARLHRKVIRAELTGEWRAFGMDWITGLDFSRDYRDAMRSQQPALVPQSRVMPDAWVSRAGFNIDAVWRTSLASRLKFGVRLEGVEAVVRDLDVTGLVTPGFGPTPTPRALYAQYYGYKGDGVESEVNFSAKLRYEHDFDGGAGQWFAGLRRVVRTADPRERFFVSFTPPIGQALEPGPIHRTWIGNPLLAPEQHHLGEVGAGWARNGWTFATRAYADRATDFILHDRARAQQGILVNNHANIFRNVDAFIAGIETLAGYRFASGWFVNHTVHWTCGQNLTDNRPIA
jgi:iron complex outermembrane receptor protein